MLKKTQISRAITAIFLAVFIWYGLSNKQIFLALSGVSVASIILITLGRFVVYFSNGLFTKWSAELFTKKISLGEGVYISILSAVGNFFGPLLGGTSIRAVYLKKVHGLTYSYFTSTLIGYYLILFIINCLMALTALAFLPKDNKTNFLLVFFGLWLGAMLLLSRLRLPSRVTGNNNKNAIARRITKVLVNTEEGWQQILSDKKLLLKLVLIAALSFLGGFMMYYFEFNALGISTYFPTVLLYTSFVTISLLISLTPGAIGIRETILLITSATMGLAAEDILKLAVLDRAINFSLLFLLFLVMRSKKLKKWFTKREINI